jgi:hypothetical protein
VNLLDFRHGCIRHCAHQSLHGYQMNDTNFHSHVVDHQTMDVTNTNVRRPVSFLRILRIRERTVRLLPDDSIFLFAYVML